MHKVSKRLFRWQSLTLVLMAVGYTGYYFCRSNFSLVLPKIIEELTAQGMSFNDAKIQMGTVASISVLGYAIAKFFNGPLSEILGGRRGFLLGMLGSVVFTLLFSLGGTIPFFTLAAIANRLFQSMGWVNMVKISSRWFSYSTYGTAMGFLSLSYLFGDALARKTLSYFMSLGFDWRTVFMISAGILFLLFVANFFFLRESPQYIGEEEPPENKNNLVDSGTSADGSARSIREIIKILLTNRIFLLTCFLSLGTTLVRETFNTWTALYFTDIGFDQVTAAANTAWFPFFGGISVLLAGFASDKLGYNGRALIIVYGMILTAVLLVLLGTLNFGLAHYWQVFLVAMIAFVLIGPYSYLGGAMALDLGGRRGSAIAAGLIDGVGYLGGFLAGGSIAKISVLYGWKGAFFSLAGIALISAVAAVYYMFEQRKLVVPKNPEMSLEKVST